MPTCYLCGATATTAVSALSYAHSAAAREVWDGVVKRSFGRRPQGLRARMEKDIVKLQVRAQSGAVIELPGLAIDGARALAVLKKVVRGIYFRDQGSMTQNWPEVNMGETFRYRSIHSPEGSMIWFEFYRF